MSATIKETGEIQLPTHCLDLTRGAEGRLFAACLDGGVYEVDVAARSHRLLARHESYASGVNWCDQVQRLVSAGYDGMLRWIDPAGPTVECDVQAHRFWSWQSALSPDGSRLASSTGQYLCGGYKYEPAPEVEPSVKIFDTTTGEKTHHFEHVPPVESVAFSNDGAYLAAGNLMGEVRLWELASGEECARISTGSFTGWGIIKGHYYTGGVFSLAFAPDDSALYLAGMGSTRDPAAGNGKQLWEKWSWKDGNPQKLGSAHDGEIGEGLMESLAFHPSGHLFAMAGRLFKGDWNAALFDAGTGGRLCHLNCGMRISRAVWNGDGSHLYLAGGHGQPKGHKDLENPTWGRVKICEVAVS